MDGFIEHLVSIEQTRGRVGDFRGEVVCNVLHHHAIAACKEAENGLDEVTLIVIELVTPVGNVLVQRNFFHRPECGHCLLVHCKYVGVLDWESRVLAVADVSE
ncbi:hypothetical protein MT325_m656R [Paramecium bursaria chlorella virus MT325]|uniref:Uncharacterized protein m656R n=1 Tax=Paramecium bursaria Chlorella virus MT325 TaxID=346932 RepID=A7IV36_PBCVM|nr:hypothetical protein MT325_m656R [Paramecium bursaria chlorella virus MT325]